LCLWSCWLLSKALLPFTSLQMSFYLYWTILILGLLTCDLLFLLLVVLMSSWLLVLVCLLMFWTYFSLVVLLIVHCLTHQVFSWYLFCWSLILSPICSVLQTLLGTLTVLHWCKLNWVVLQGLLSPVLQLYVQQ